MKEILSPDGLRALQALARTRPLLAFDFDGTLAPLADHPSRVHLPPTTKQLLLGLQRHAPVVIVTGRAIADVQLFLEDLSVRIVGNHGAEGIATPETLARAEVASGQLSAYLETWLRSNESIKTIWIEQKQYSVTAHGTGSEISLLATACRPLCDELSMRAMSGKACLNFIPTVLPHKGQAVRSLMQEYDCDTCFFIGDDVTDEDVFRETLPPTSLGVRVGSPNDSAAHFYCPTQASVERVLAELLAAFERQA